MDPAGSRHRFFLVPVLKNISPPYFACFECGNSPAPLVSCASLKSELTEAEHFGRINNCA
jgi:hypothetical protein